MTRHPDIQDLIQTKEALRKAQNAFDKKYESFVKHILEAREQAKVTIEDLATKTKIPKSRLINVLYNGNKSLTPEEMRKFMNSVHSKHRTTAI